MDKKWLIGILLFVTLGFFAITSNCCRISSYQELNIGRTEHSLEVSAAETEAALGNGFIRKYFIIPPTFLNSPSDYIASDPFAEVKNTSSTKRLSARELLENHGITFGEEATAFFNASNGRLTVINAPDEMKLIEAAIYRMGGGLEKQIAIRAEIFEMPALMALDMLESAAVEGTHTAERNALRKALDFGSVKLINATTIIARSGQRAKVEDADDFPLPVSKTDSIKKEDENGNRPDWEIRKIGTVFEVDPVLGVDEYTIDLNLSLEHHTASPDERHTKSDSPATLHGKQITTQITTRDGASILVGSWKPTGKPEYERNDLMHLVFITANFQRPTAPVEIHPESGVKK